ncbi:MAG TPA: GAP family protein [Candidatus Saccharimonadales bacterium]
MPLNIVGLIVNLFVLTFLGLLIAFSPMLIIVNMVIVLTTKRPIWNALILTAGVVTPLILIAILAEIFIGPHTSISISSISAKIQLPSIIDLLFGITLIIVALKRAYTYKQEEVHQVKSLTPPSDKPKSLFIFGFLKSLLSVTNIFAILLVVQITKTYNRMPIVNVLGLFYTILIGIIPLMLIIYYRQYRPGSLAKMNQKLDNLLKTNIQLFIVILLLLFGVYFIISGVRNG